LHVCVSFSYGKRGRPVGAPTLRSVAASRFWEAGTELQTALAEATQTDKRTAGVFLDTLGAFAYKEIKKKGEFVLPGFGKLVKQKRKARTGFNPKTQQKIKIPAKTVVKFRVRPQRAENHVRWVSL
jgi:DNA-binding protein HU-beta